MKDNLNLKIKHKEIKMYKKSQKNMEAKVYVRSEKMKTTYSLTGFHEVLEVT